MINKVLKFVPLNGIGPISTLLLEGVNHVTACQLTIDAVPISRVTTRNERFELFTQVALR